MEICRYRYAISIFRIVDSDRFSKCVSALYYVVKHYKVIGDFWSVNEFGGGNMRLNAISSQVNATNNVNMFGHPMKKKVTNAANPMAMLNQKHELKKQIMAGDKQNNMSINSVLDSSKSYLESLREARNKKKDASLEKKKIKYSYKSISSKIISCKKSYNAKEVISLAKREIARLRKLRGKEGYDVEELEAAIAHAQAMERVAKKKARHLEEEEMAKAASGACMGGIEEREEVGDEDVTEDAEELSDEENEVMERDIPETEEFDFEDIASVDDIDILVSRMQKDMTEELTSLMDEMGLEELSDDLGMSVDKDMDPADLKMMMIKHRSKEMKDIAKADGDYLKALFQKFERDRASIALSMKMNAPAINMNISNEGMSLAQIVNVPTVDVPVADASVSGTPAVSIDISV